MKVFMARIYKKAIASGLGIIAIALPHLTYATDSSSQLLGYKPIFFENYCHHPIDLWFRYETPSGIWYTDILAIDIDHSDYLYNVNGSKMTFRNNVIYYYAESSISPDNIYWAGSNEIRVDDYTVSMRRFELDPNDEDWYLSLSCD